MNITDRISYEKTILRELGPTKAHLEARISELVKQSSSFAGGNKFSTRNYGEIAGMLAEIKYQPDVRKIVEARLDALQKEPNDA